MDREGLIELIKLKLKFASSSAIATAVDFALYLIFVSYVFAPAISNVISAGVGMLINFFLQKAYVFDVNRKVSEAFLISLSTSIVGIGISTLIQFQSCYRTPVSVSGFQSITCVYYIAQQLATISGHNRRRLLKASPIDAHKNGNIIQRAIVDRNRVGDLVDHLIAGLKKR